MNSFFSSFDLNGYGMSAQRARVNIISSNIANSETTRTSEGGPYKRKSLIYKTFDFKSVLDGLQEKYNLHGLKYSDPLREGDTRPPDLFSQGVFVDKVIRDDSPPKLKYSDPLREGDTRPPDLFSQGVFVDKVIRDDSPPKLKYEPSHPDANSEGYVAYPNINPVVEMADLIEATRAYQSNVAAFENTKGMYNSTISLLQ